MAGFSQYLQQKVLDHVFKTASYTVPTNIYIELYTAAPADTGGGTPVSGVNYARALCNVWDAASAASPSLVQNTADVSFNTPGAGGWGTVTHFGVFDNISAGNLLAWGALAIQKTINQNDVVKFLAGDLEVTLD